MPACEGDLVIRHAGDDSPDVSGPPPVDRHFASRRSSSHLPACRRDDRGSSRTVQSAGLQLDQITRILLVGGSSRIPLVAQLIQELTERPVFLDAHPKHAIATGAAIIGGEELAPFLAGREDTSSVPIDDTGSPPASREIVSEADDEMIAVPPPNVGAGGPRLPTESEPSERNVRPRDRLVELGPLPPSPVRKKSPYLAAVAAAVVISIVVVVMIVNRRNDTPSTSSTPTTVFALNANTRPAAPATTVNTTSTSPAQAEPATSSAPATTAPINRVAGDDSRDPRTCSDRPRRCDGSADGRVSGNGLDPNGLEPRVRGRLHLSTLRVESDGGCQERHRFGSAHRARRCRHWSEDRGAFRRPCDRVPNRHLPALRRFESDDGLRLHRRSNSAVYAVPDRSPSRMDTTRIHR